MSFLSPLFALAGLSIALPILFHLVRKRPKDRQLFSSLMFLEPAPPRLTSQSRVDQWLLLLMRALALGLLAAAFSRPYWNVPAETDTNSVGLRRMILIDTSASMQRPGLWETAIARVEKIVEQSVPTDVLALYAFDRSLKPLVSVEEAIGTAPSQRQQLARAGLKSAKPTWMGTDLGSALVNAADLLQADSDASADSSTSASEIVIVTDFQNGMSLEKLTGYTWPSTCKVRIERLEPTALGNARATLLTSTGPEEGLSKPQAGPKGSPRDEPSVRVRVANYSPSAQEQFQLSWLDAKGMSVPSSVTKCQVPSGSSLVVQMPSPPVNSQALKLEGDRSEFDNQFYIAKTEPVQSTLICLDARNQLPEDSLSYFLEQLPLSSPSQVVRYEARAPGSDEVWPTPSQSPLIVASHHATVPDLIQLAKYIELGGNVLWVLDAASEKLTEGLRSLTGESSISVSEAKVKNYAMLEQIDFRHPLFADLSSSRFNDFTKVRFWKHRKLEFQDDKGWQNLARFDDGSPALLSRAQGAGKLWILTAGWQPSQSQLALSSKFVPIMAALFRLAAPQESDSDKHTVGGTLAWSSGERLIDPTGVELGGESGLLSSQTEQPGIYHRMDQAGRDVRIAVNLDDSESLTTVADVERLERLGVAMLDQRPQERKEGLQRQLRAVELEAKQGWWRWLVMGVLGAVGIESLLCIARNRFA